LTNFEPNKITESGVKHSLFVTFLILVNLIAVTAQQNADIFRRLEQHRPYRGEVKINQDSLVAAFMEYHLQTASKLKGIKGYRISIFRDTGQNAREKCMAVRSRFKSKYADIPFYEEFVYPYYKLYVGDFRTESEALKFLKIIERNFHGAFIVRDNISYPELK
jgi:hypothetical protein